MPAPDDSIVEVIRLYRETLLATRALYISSGELIRGSYGWLTGGQADDPQWLEANSIADQMDQLHQGLVMKVYATAVPQLQPGALQQRQLGRVTLEHIWGTTVMGSQLQEAVRWLIDESAKFRWADLVRPFAELPPLRDKWGELETLIVRMATLITTSDGDQSTQDNQLLGAMKRQLDDLRHHSPEKFVDDAKPSRDALQWLREEAKRLRDGVTVDDATAPAASGTTQGSAGPHPRTQYQLRCPSQPKRKKPPQKLRCNRWYSRITAHPKNGLPRLAANSMN